MIGHVTLGNFIETALFATERARISRFKPKPSVELLSSYCRVTVELLQTVGPDRGVQTLVKCF